jgi:RNA polymerase sigma factor (TIGR02999 family)
VSQPLDVTGVLLEATDGSQAAAERLTALVYSELHARAEQLLRMERRHHTLQPTELIHEAYLRLVDQTRCRWHNEAHFLAIASRVMRRILVDHARQRNAGKRGGKAPKLSLDEALDLGVEGVDTTVLALDLALDRLAVLHHDIARVVELKFFGGLTAEECARVLDISLRTVQRRWDFAQAWLYREMKDGTTA